MSELETKLAAARTRLILDKPFLGALVMRLPLRAAQPEWCPTVGTDARHFYYNPEYIERLTLEQTQFMLAHEALHCALSHFARRHHRVQHRWDLACDFAINPLLVRDGLKPPPGALILDLYEGMTAEEIYPSLNDNDTDQTLDKHLYDGEGGGGGSGDNRDLEQSAGRAGAQPERSEDAKQAGEDADEESQAPSPPPLSQQEREELAARWQQYLASAAQSAQAAGKLSGSMARLVDHLLQPKLPWRVLLARYMSLSARDDYSWQRPSRREGTMLFPSLRSAQVEVAVALDISGSIPDQAIGEFLAEVDALKAQIRARVVLLACDTDLADGAPWQFEPWETLAVPRNLNGGGGTRFTPVFEWLERQPRRPDLLIYFTDGEGEYPPAQPDYPVLWLVKGKAEVPWGQRIQLN